MQYRKSVSILILSSVFGGVSGCSVRKEMKDMHDSTGQMNQTTREMNQTTKEMSETTREMQKEMVELRNDIRTEMGALRVSLEEMLVYTQGLSENMVTMNKMMTQMTKNTQSMMRSTRGLEKQTEEMAQLAKTLDQTAKNTYRDMRQGECAKIRNDSLTRLEKAITCEAKFAEAGKYLMSYEFQLWNGTGLDTPERREALFRDAAMEFMRIVNDSMQRDVLPLLDDRNDPLPIFFRDQLNNLYALAVALDEVNPSQAKLVASQKVERVSMLTLIERALRAKAEIQKGELKQSDLLQYQHEILVYEKQARFLLQARANFLPAIVLSMVSKINDPGLNKYISQAQNYLLKWSPDTSKLNLSELAEMKRAMSEAIRAYQILKETGSREVLNAPMLKIFQNMKPFELASTKGLSGKKLSALRQKNESLSELQSLVEKFKRL